MIKAKPFWRKKKKIKKINSHQMNSKTPFQHWRTSYWPSKKKHWSKTPKKDHKCTDNYLYTQNKTYPLIDLCMALPNVDNPELMAAKKPLFWFFLGLPIASPIEENPHLIPKFRKSFSMDKQINRSRIPIEKISQNLKDIYIYIKSGSGRENSEE